jgi:hypothetical protein
VNTQAERERHRNAGGISETSEPGKYFTATAAAYSAEPERSAGLDAAMMLAVKSTPMRMRKSRATLPAQL